MDFKKTFFSQNIIFVLIIFIVGLFVFSPTFSMAIYGDEWQMLWYGKAISLGHLSPQLAETWNAYRNEMIVFNFLADTFGYQGFSFYFFSFICRFFAASVLYIFLLRRGLGKDAAFAGGLLFMVTPIGIEATDWVRNFDSYIGIVFWLIGVDLIFNLKSIRSFLLLVLCFICGILTNPLRSHGLLLVFSTLLFASVVLSALLQKKLHKYGLLGLIFVIILYYFFILIGVFGKLAGDPVGQGFELGQGLKSLMASAGNSIVPNFSYPVINFQLILFGALVVISLYLFEESFFKKTKIHLVLIGGGIAAASLVYFYPLAIRSSVAIEAYFMLFLSGYILLNIRRREFARLLLVVMLLGLNLGYMFYPTLRQSWFAASFDHRYLIYSSLVIPILFSLIINKVKKDGLVIRYMIAGLTFLTFVIYMFINYNFLNLQKTKHSESYCGGVRNQVLSAIEGVDFNSSRKFFVFITNDQESAKVYDCLTFGFMYISGIRFNIWNENLLPIAVYESEEGIKSIWADGETTKKYTGYKRIISENDIYVFKIQSGIVKKILLQEIF